jgi:hypothetical protein
VQTPLGQDEKPSLDPPTVLTAPIVLPKELTDVLSSIKKESVPPPKETLQPETKPAASRDPRY